MFIILLLLLELTFNQENDTPETIKEPVTQLTSACRCSQILSKADCKLYCHWDSNKQQKCRDRLCSDYNNEDECNGDLRDYCYYENSTCHNLLGQNCTLFDNEYKCKGKDDCEWNSTACDWQSNKKPKDPQNIVCINQTNQTACDNQIETNSGFYCNWELNQSSINETTYYCNRYEIKECSSVDSLDTEEEIKEKLCHQFPTFCRYTITIESITNVIGQIIQQVTYSCQQRNCGDYGTQALCEEHYYYQDFGGSVYLCSWNDEGQSCDEGYIIEDNTTLFSNENCYDKTFLYQLTWDENAGHCTQCPGFGKIISIMMILIYIFI